MKNINAQLVETVARRYLDAQLEKLNTAANKANIPADAFRTWDELDGVSKFNRAEYALRDLDLIIPVLIEHGWMPPEQATEIRESAGAILDRGHKLSKWDNNGSARAHQREGRAEGYIESGNTILGLLGGEKP